MSTNEKQIINALHLNELSDAREMINQNLLERIDIRVEELKGEIKLLEDDGTDDVDEVDEEDTKYQKFFRKALDKFGVDSPTKLKDDKKKEFFDYVDKNWTGEKDD